MKKVVVFIMLTVIVIIGCCSGCQPTPDHDIIVNKAEATIPVAKTADPKAAATDDSGANNDGDPDKTAAPFDFPEGDPKASRADIPEHVKLEADPQNDIHVVIDAEVTIDRNGSFPVIEVRRMKTMSDPGFVKKMISLLCPSESTVYKAWPETKDEIAEKLATLMGYDGRLGELVFVEPDDIDYYREMYKAAPNEPERTAVGLEEGFSPEQYYVEYPDGGIGLLNFLDDGASGAFLMNRYDWICYKGMMVDSRGKSLPTPDLKLDISKEDAVKIAEEFFSAMGMPGYSPEKSREVFILNSNNYEFYDRRWELTFSRQIGSGVSFKEWDDESFIAFSDPRSVVGNPWKRAERIHIYISDEGIKQISWTTLTETTGIIAEDVAFLGLNEIIQRVSDQFGFEYAGSGSTIKIDSMELVYGLVSEKNAADRGLYVPLWQIDYNELEGEPQEMRLFFSAIDGGVVEPRIQTNLGGY